MPPIKRVTRKKSADIVRLITPAFGLVPGQDVEIKFDDIANGVCLYGDTSKREGMRAASDYADRKKTAINVIEIILDFNDKSPQGVIRLNEEDLLSGKYGMVKLERYATKVDLTEHISSLLCDRAKALYPKARSREPFEWLFLDPKIARVIFDHYPIDLVVVSSRPYYLSKDDKPVMVAVIRDARCINTASVLYGNNVAVKIV